MSGFPTIELTVYPFECDAFGHLNEAAFLAVFERARWDALARGPGIDLFRKNGVWPAVRKAGIEYHAAVYPGDVLRIETMVARRGTTSFTLRQSATRASDGVRVSDAELVLVCIDPLGRPAPIPEAVGTFLGPRVTKGTEMLRVEIGKGEAQLPVEVRGDSGDVILFVHGFPLDHTMWRHQMAGLTKWKRVAPDLRGMGGASTPPRASAYSMGHYADDLIAVLDQVGARRAVVCGLSMGGYIVFELLRRHPERIRALVLCDTKAESDTAEGRKARDEQAGLAEREGVGAVVDRLLPKLLGKTTHKAQPELVAEVREVILRSSVPGFAGALRAMRDRPDSTPDLGGIRVPTLVVGGAEDELIPPAVTQQMATLIPGARYESIKSAGHMAPLEQPLAVGRVLGEFLEALPK